MSYYVYRTTIYHPRHVLYYYGMKHYWNSKTKEEYVGADPNYAGSCKCRHFKSWISKYNHTTEVVQWCTESNVRLWETYYILAGLCIHGSYFRSYYGRLQGFKQGWCLNAHWSGMEGVQELGIVAEAERRRAEGSTENQLRQIRSGWLKTGRDSINSNKQLRVDRSYKSWDTRKCKCNHYRITCPDGQIISGTWGECSVAMSSRLGYKYVCTPLSNCVKGVIHKPDRGVMYGYLIELL